MTEYKVHAEIAEDPVRGDEVVILHGEFIHDPAPFRVHREGGQRARWEAEFTSAADLRRKFRLLRDACDRCIDRLRYDMAEVWRQKSQEILEKACASYVKITPRASRK